MPESTSVAPLRVHDLKQWAYCPRIVFYEYVMPVDKKSTYKMEHGHAAEEAIDRLEKRRKLTEVGLRDGKRRFHVWCKSDRLGLTGKLDLLIEAEAELFPVDFKDSEQALHPNHIVQLCGYALLLEDEYQIPVNRGFIFFIPTEEIVAVELTSERKQHAFALLGQIRGCIQRESLPEPTEVRTRCEGCEYRNYCADIF
jgi:CRISPR-associated exonuclease Cas4